MTIRIYVADTMLYRTVGMIQDAIDYLDKNDPKYYVRMGEAMERFAIEASMAKVYGSETSSMIVDNCLQIFGGYGFIEEYPIAMAYRDDRINRIWEGTNEINRSIITGYLMKNVLMEEISLRDIIKTKELINSVVANDRELLSEYILGIEAAKIMVVLIFHEALCQFGQDLKHEQQLSEILSNMFTLLYTMESVICRAKQISPSIKSNLMADIARVHVAESLLDLSKFAFKCLNRIFPSNIPSEILTNVNALQGKIQLSTDTISLKRELAEYVLAEKKYPF